MIRQNGVGVEQYLIFTFNGERILLIWSVLLAKETGTLPQGVLVYAGGSGADAAWVKLHVQPETIGFQMAYMDVVFQLIKTLGHLGPLCQLPFDEVCHDRFVGFT